MQPLTLDVPTARFTAALGVTLAMLTFKPPTCCTLNVWELEPATSSVSSNVSVIVGATGVGAGGATGSLHPDVSTLRLRAIMAGRIHFIVLKYYLVVGRESFVRWLLVGPSSLDGQRHRAHVREGAGDGADGHGVASGGRAAC